MNITENTLVFKLGADNNFSDLKITTEIKHFIADLRGVSVEVAENIKNKFITFAGSVSAMNGSFVIICEFSFDDDGETGVVTATSTDEMPGGAGNKVEYDKETGKFTGYGQGSGDK